ncbi:MAG TPA: alpha/beta fold hydrolase [Acidimicrobiia bacterium]|nr:alpha/beta fold hydrolase [Acidimicrobiia bacterium]
MELSWELTGEQGPVICLVHPLGMDRHFWDWLQADLSIPVTWLLVDLPGHGASPLPGDAYTIEDVADGIAEIVDREGLSPIHVLGSSFGGLVALAFGQRHRPLTSSIVVADSTPRYAEGFGWPERASAVRSRGLEPLVQGTLERWFSPAAQDVAPAQVDYVRSRLLATDPEGYALACEALGAADLTPHLSEMDLPALIIAGTDDVLASDSQLMADNLPRASLVWLPGGRHGAPLELQREFAGAVNQFLRNYLKGGEDGR